MATTPFHYVPKRRFLFRMIGPAFGVFFAGYVAMGILAVDPALTGPKRAPTAILKTDPVTGPALTAGRQHLAQMTHSWFNIPEVCWGGNQVNEFQTRQCADFWERMWLGSAVAAIPFAAVALFFFLALEQIAGFYRRQNRKVVEGQAILAGTVTDPPEAPNDFFGWFFCLRAITVELRNRKQIRVYLPVEAPVPLPGQTLAIFDGGNVFGAQRYVAVLYAPHLAIVAGS